jgi:hypothetical protein
MKRSSICVALLLLLFPCAAHGQEPADSELDLVAKLRAKGYADLAKEYLDQLQKRNDPALAGALPLEQARTLVALAREKDVDQRIGMIAAARTELEAFVKQNAGKPEGAQAALELARLASLQGQAVLTQALREEDPKTAHERARPAEALFQQAGKDLIAAIKALQAAVDDYRNPDPKVEKAKRLQLTDDLSHARFDSGINLIDQARTYIDIGAEGVNRKRAEIIEEARKVFDKLAKDDNAAAGTLANAWLMKVSMEQQVPQETGKYFKRVMAQEGRSYQPAKRWARLFFMQNLINDPTYGKLKPDEKLKMIEKEGRSWLKDYPSAVKSPEGQQVLFELANALIEQARKAKDQKAKAVLDQYTDAQKYLGMLAQMDGDLSQKANQMNLALGFQLSGSKTDLRTFDDFNQKGMAEYLKWQQVNKKLGEAGGKERDALERERKQHLQAMVTSLARAVGLSTSKTPIQKLDDTRFYLTWGYIFNGDLERAAIAGEALGRSRPPTPMGAKGASAALDAYANLLERDPDFSTRARLKDLADYVLSPEQQKAWAGDPVADYAHYQLAMLHKRDDDNKGAIEHLEKVSPAFPAYIYAQGQAVFLAQEAREKAKEPAEQKFYVEAAKRALKRMPPLGDKVDPSTATMYFLAQMEQGKFLYSEASEDLKAKHPDKAALKYIEMGKTLDELHQRFEKASVKMSGESRDRIEYTMGVLRKYSDLGLADVEFNKGNYEAVFKTTEKVVDRVLKDAKDPKAELRYKDHQVTGDILGLALRAYIQKGEVDKGRELLGALQRLQGDGNDLGADRSNYVRRVLQDISGQVEALKTSGKKEDTERLKSMVGNFTSFLDAIGKESEKKGHDPEATRMLAYAYASLDQHAKAASIYAKVPAPACLDNKKLSEKEAEQVASYWGMRLEYGKALRQGKSKEDLAEALKVLNQLLAHPNARYQILADMEKNLVLEDEEKYGVALLQWGKFVKNPALTNGLADPKVQKIFFPGVFYKARLTYKYGKYEAKKESKPKFIRAAAMQLVGLEFTPDKVGWTIVEPMARELLQAEPELREEYDKAKAEREKAK